MYSPEQLFDRAAESKSGIYVECFNDKEATNLAQKLHRFRLSETKRNKNFQELIEEYYKYRISKSGNIVYLTKKKEHEIGEI